MTAHGHDHGHGAEEEPSLFATAHGHGAEDESSLFATAHGHGAEDESSLFATAHGHGADDESSLFATAHGHGHGADDEQSPFAELMAQVMASAERFGHRQHVHLTWLAVRRYGTADAVGLVSDGIQRTARYAGVPQKYHATVSRAWVELVGHHAAHSDTASFDAFAGQHPALLDKKLLTRFYRPATLASTPARTGWVEPDLAPFPWQQTAR